MTNRKSSFRQHLARVGACLLLGIVPGAAALGDAANADTAWQQHVTSFLSAHCQPLIFRSTSQWWKYQPPV